MRPVLVLALLCALAPAARADTPKPLGKLSAPEGRFFDESFAVSPDGKLVAAVSTDTATSGTLVVWVAPGEQQLSVDGLPLGVVSVAFLSNDRILVVARKDEERVTGWVATIKDVKGKRALALDKARLGPATAIEVVDRDGKRIVGVYTKGGKKTPEHAVQVYDAALKSIARRTLVETNEGLLRSKTGEVRAIWWSKAHTSVGAQKIGEYDKARDIRRPHRFVRLDLVADKILDEREIEDVMGFAKVSVVRKTAPAEEAFARLADDRKEILLLDGLDERPLPLARDLVLYQPESLRSQIADDKTLFVGLQVDASNAVAVSKRVQDPDDFDLYLVERASLHDPAKQPVAARRVLTVPGEGRPVAFAVGGGKVAVLRKAKGFDHGGPVIELHALP